MSTRGRILIVDDDAAFVKSTVDLLSAQGYETLVATDGVSGLAKVRVDRPDLTILDVGIATATAGFEAKLKTPALAELRRTAVLLVRGKGKPSAAEARLEPDKTWLPVNRVLQKPVEPAGFVAAVAELLRTRARFDLKAGSGKTVQDILSEKAAVLHGISPDATVFEAIQMMDKCCVGALMVMQGTELVGIISERDYARKVILEGRSSKSAKVREIMTSKVIYVTPGQTLEECMALMTHKRIRHLPVLKDGKLVGIVSIGDLVRATIAEKNFLIEQLGKYIAGT